ncbi:MAG: Smr/MutS family protein [Verrucomicrobia bacterium]|nr:Smr/MutS family protein [Verrucomicrobiota bacterium]
MTATNDDTNNGMDSESTPDPPVPIPITGELDLHTFQPREVKEVVAAYLDECRKRGILTVRIVHGKGIGNLRRTVHALLEQMPGVESFALAGESFGGWGATMTRLRPLRPLHPATEMPQPDAPDRHRKS